MTKLWRAFFLFFLGVGSASFARKTNLNDNQRGIVLGMGQYFYPIRKSHHQHEPASQWKREDQSLVNLERYSIYPTKVGLFWTTPISNMEIYGRYVFNNKKTWTSVENPAGQGRTTYKAPGVGLLLGWRLIGEGQWRVLFHAHAEYLRYKAYMQFQPTDSAMEIITLGANTYTAGGGLSWEYWIADLWVLSFLSGYSHPFSAKWSVKGDGGKFMGIQRSPGAAVTDDGETKINALFGGFYVEASLKLNFYSF